MKIQKRSATPSDLLALHQLMVDAKKQMIANGVNQWTNGYPNSSIIYQDIIDRNVLIYGENFDSAVTVTQTKDSWIFHRLMVNSASAGKGFATNILKDLINEGSNKGVTKFYIETHNTNFAMLHVLTKLKFISTQRFIKSDRSNLGYFIEFVHLTNSPLKSNLN
ncbi:GNAT family N-acetyltransferase [Paucilactobacillus wasatchensis]|uniref:Histone acetyltransferase HPA2 n=1 Tax=Paucilactobacillus wasatchensis TaxID=1335616 RepID=A0A0D1A917_9LACO|nr:GNAT family N-acetyltransferase [Paucilactobacillus wasatchensis]KIS04320.1 Histone acetyltransferase HPA2 [Paucilactobacillus wasatchensis]